MLRDWDLQEISDGKKYMESDMVKADCNDCKGCSACCKDMGNSIVLDPLDVYRLTTNLNVSFEQLLEKSIHLSVIDGIILPILSMDESKTDKSCVYLNEEGRCSIHAFRPGICRIFPLGRVYENNDFYYILQVHECAKTDKSKIKVGKWIDTQDVKRNHQFIVDWHYFLKSFQDYLSAQEQEERVKNMTMLFLHTFYLEPYKKEEDFFGQFKLRLEKMKSCLK